MSKIAVLMDCSTFSMRALPVAEKFAVLLQAEIVVVTVIGPGRDDQLEEIRIAHENLDQISESLSCPSRHRLEQGNVVAELLRVIEEEAPDLVIMSSHGSTGLLELPVGSVTRDVIAKCTVPVMVVGREVEKDSVMRLAP